MSQSGRQKYNFNNQVSFKDGLNAKSPNYLRLKADGASCAVFNGTSLVLENGKIIAFYDGVDNDVSLKRDSGLLTLSLDGSNYGQIARIKTGQYTGNGNTTQFITTDFEPLAAIVTPHHPDTDTEENTEFHFGHTLMNEFSNARGVRIYSGNIKAVISGGVRLLQSTGFYVGDMNADAHPNKNNYVYDYLYWG